jgi:hypothetical protein
VHVIDSKLFNFPTGAPIYLSFDFGRTPVCHIAVITAAGRVIVVEELMGDDMSIDTFFSDMVQPVLRAKYNSSPIEGSWADPAGEAKGQSTEMSPYSVLLSYGVPVTNPGSNKIEPRLEAVRQFLTQLDGMGKPKFQILDTCNYTINALASDYIYEEARGGVVKDKPTKSHDNWVSDLADSIQYLLMGYSSSGMGRERRSLPRRERRFL